MKRLDNRKRQHREAAVRLNLDVQPVYGVGTDCLRRGDMQARICDPCTIELYAPWHYAGCTLTVRVECRTATGNKILEWRGTLQLESSGATARAVIWLPCSLFGIGGFGLIDLFVA